MAWKLFLDDDADTIRSPEISVEDDHWRSEANLPQKRPVGHQVAPEWVIARTYDEAVHLIETLGFPDFVSFDHDLGDEKSGKDLANYLAALDMDEGTMPMTFSWEAHSGNRIGRTNIDCYLQNYMQNRAEKLQRKLT